jgi:hypothetical protein
LQTKLTFVTLPLAVPLPLLTEQYNPVGCVNTVTVYVAPLLIAMGKVNVVAPFATDKLLPALFCNTNPNAVRPVIVPPIV